VVNRHPSSLGAKIHGVLRWVWSVALFSVFVWGRG
jgi:hypothetical protein